jgi:hypothetical protein
MAKGVSKGQQLIRVKTVDENGNWYTISKHFGWNEATDAYNAIPAPKIIATRTKIIHKQLTNNGFVFNKGTDPRIFTA